MTRTRRARRFLLLAIALTIPLLTSGCAVLQFSSSGGAPLGQVQHGVRICASGPGANQCADKGNINLDATSGLRQLLLGAQIPADVGAPASLVSTAPESVPFSESPGYAAELQRLQPAPAGRKWVGWISPTINYATANSFQQSLFVAARWQLPRKADGSPYSIATLTSTWVVGIRNIAGDAPADRAVACGPSLTQAFKDGAGDNSLVYCLDSQVDVTSASPDYGVVTTGARASGLPGTVATMPFILRNANIEPFVFGTIPVSATTTLPGATVEVTPGTLRPPQNGDGTAFAAVGIPVDARPGTYEVTFTADFGSAFNGVRTGVGTLTVLAPPGGGGGAAGGGGTPARGPARRTFTTTLPKGLSVANARASGVSVLIGSSAAGPALIRLRQGSVRKPAVSLGKRVRLKAPGPVKVTFRSRRLAKGPFRVTISVAGKVVRTTGGRLVR
ncbi:hypothetical protein [Miltoncostaea oceani]|uniref:hypothetical protein n=1 Tax=Miltoncostaea oceani TaxID=2843216 RepID=UPI001C3E07BF|nr:hypothetical protein [Miltoncostaea oceani]